MAQTDDNAATLSSPMEPSPSAAALRMRQHRKRRRKGLFCLMLEVRFTEIDALVRRGLLMPETRNSLHDIRAALYAFLDRSLGRTP
jgi:hypothetical protein